MLQYLLFSQYLLWPSTSSTLSYPGLKMIKFKFKNLVLQNKRTFISWTWFELFNLGPVRAILTGNSWFLQLLHGLKLFLFLHWFQNSFCILNIVQGLASLREKNSNKIETYKRLNNHRTMMEDLFLEEEEGFYWVNRKTKVSVKSIWKERRLFHRKVDKRKSSSAVVGRMLLQFWRSPPWKGLRLAVWVRLLCCTCHIYRT